MAMSSRSAIASGPSVSDGRARVSSTAALRCRPVSTRSTSTPPCGVDVVMRRSSMLGREGVEPALGLAHAAPAAGPFGFSRRGGTRARPATDAGVALIEQRVRGNAVLADVAAHILARPVSERKSLEQRAAAELVVLEHLGLDPGLGLVSPYRAQPG